MPRETLKREPKRAKDVFVRRIEDALRELDYGTVFELYLMLPALRRKSATRRLRFVPAPEPGCTPE